MRVVVLRSYDGDAKGEVAPKALSTAGFGADSRSGGRSHSAHDLPSQSLLCRLSFSFSFSSRGRVSRIFEDNHRQNSMITQNVKYMAGEVRILLYPGTCEW